MHKRLMYLCIQQCISIQANICITDRSYISGDWICTSAINLSVLRECPGAGNGDELFLVRIIMMITVAFFTYREFPHTKVLSKLNKQLQVFLI